MAVAVATENVLDCGLDVGEGRVGATYGLGFEPHEKHVHKESRSYAKASTAAGAAFYTHPNANVFLRLIQFMHLQLRHQL
jgi:hypothetical protein